MAFLYPDWVSNWCEIVSMWPHVLIKICQCVVSVWHQKVIFSKVSKWHQNSGKKKTSSICHCLGVNVILLNVKKRNVVSEIFWHLIVSHWHLNNGILMTFFLGVLPSIIDADPPNPAISSWPTEAETSAVEEEETLGKGPWVCPVPLSTRKPPAATKHLSTYLLLRANGSAGRRKGNPLWEFSRSANPAEVGLNNSPQIAAAILQIRGELARGKGKAKKVWRVRSWMIRVWRITLVKIG